MRTWATGRIPKTLMPVVNAMTNWQRNQWARAGYPIETPKARRYTRLRKRT